METSNKQTFNYLEATAEKKSMLSFKCKLFLLALGFVFSVEYGVSQESSFAQNKNVGFGVSNFFDPSDYKNSNSQPESKKIVALDTTEILDVKGSFDGTVEDFKGIYSAKLVLDNKVIEIQTSNTKKSFLFTLKRNKLYAIILEKDGYISKTISFSTISKDKLDEKNSYLFKFETNMISEDLRGRFNDDEIDFPTALVSYSKSCDCFEHNKEYTATSTKKMMNNLFFGE